MNKVKKKI